MYDASNKSQLFWTKDGGDSESEEWWASFFHNIQPLQMIDTITWLFYDERGIQLITFYNLILL